MIDFLKRLFGNPSAPEPDNVKTAPLSEEIITDVAMAPMTFTPAQLMVGTGQSVGKQRDHNEDTIFSLSSVFADGSTELPFGLFVIADGMGGHQHGEIASGAAARAFGDYILQKLFTPFLIGDSDSQSESLLELMENGVKEAQRAVVRKAPGGGTTLTAALVLGEQVTMAHVGDSRAYFIYPDGRIQAITQDHSLVRRLQELGQITEEEAKVHPNRNVLYRALGQADPFRPDIHTHPMPQPGFMLLCSDGLWGVVSDAEIFRIVNGAKNLSIACQELVEAANAAGGPDNISVILVQYL
ncbi:serine/threonine protein phosphatase [Longilinea arvoryzae]|uniref:Serine/threonine protein phosphatase n=1 Tax=Longilinea arvoryzae TaxID=360412 RepID=A0A0S7BHI0_9CHLR|nr:PP2C family serine/threonine-protein phosphatase [Longilinea arvoryzae]GAP14608.1 serine/threonine protein phosphatase [Longilinea arvoryzae]